MTATLIEDNEPIRCNHCTNVTFQHIDRARSAKWRIAGRNVVCPQCWDAAVVREPKHRPQPYDEPMFN